MKKLSLTLYASALFFSFMSISSCKKDDDTDNNNNNGNNTPPVACMQVSNSNIANGETVNFTSCSTNATSYLWDFGDGNTAAVQNPSHTFTAGGPYVVTLTASNNAGSDITSHTITVSAPDRNKFIGSYAGSEVCQTIGNSTYSSAISVSSINTDGVIINNFGGWNENVVATISGYNITIPTQAFGQNTFSGTGSINQAENTVTINYTVSQPGGSDGCVMTLVKQ